MEKNNSIVMVKSVRNSNFELMRIFLIIFVIIHHFNDPSRNGAFCYVEEASFLNRNFIYFIHSLTICAVDTFLLISGYFLCDKMSITVRKIVNLFSVVIIYSLLILFIRLILHVSSDNFINYLIPKNYYAWLYCTVFLLSPFLNLITINLKWKKFNTFILLIFILFSVLPTLIDFIMLKLGTDSKGISTISMDGNGRGYTLINFVLMYFLGCWIKKNESFFDRWKKKYILLYLFFSLLIFLGRFYNLKNTFNYCNVFVVIQSITFFQIFRRLKIQNKFINFLAKSVWGIFLLHGGLLNLWAKKFPVEEVMHSSFGILLLHFSICIIGVFIISFLIDKVFSLIMKPINLIFDRIPFLNYSISSKEG